MVGGGSIFHGVGVGFCLFAWVWLNCYGSREERTVPGLE